MDFVSNDELNALFDPPLSDADIPVADGASADAELAQLESVSPAARQAAVMHELADRLKELRDQKSEADELVKNLNAQIDDVNKRLADLMAETETQNFTRAGTMFSLTTKTRASAAGGRKDELFAALRQEGFGDMIYETVNANTLSSFVNEQIAENEDVLPDWLNGLVNVYEQTAVSVRKAAKKSKK